MSMWNKYHDCKGLSKTGGLLLAVLFLAVVLTAAPAQAQVLLRTDVPISGEIQKLTVTDRTDVYSGGTMVVGGYTVILPRNLLIDLPANRLSLQQIFIQAPAGCVATLESGLAKTDTCNTSGTGGFAAISAVRTAAGDIIAGDVFIQKGTELVSGTVTFINYNEGWFRMNGAPGSATTGIMVRLNDPDSRHTIQLGAGCLPGSQNCSPDPRFTLDPDNYITTFSTGYPWCIPSTVQRTFVDNIISLGTSTAQANPDGTGDVLCPSTNRTADALETAADSRRFAPLRVGDPVTAEGNFETINGVRFLSSHTTQLKKSMWTKNEATQPDYLFLEEVFINTPGFENQRIRSLIIGFTSMGPTAPDFGRRGRTDVDIWSIHRDPVNNGDPLNNFGVHEFPLASVLGCDNVGGQGTCGGMGLINAGLNIFRIRHDIDFLTANLGIDGKLSPCAHIAANPRWLGLCSPSTLENNFAILSPAPHEIIGRTGHKLDSPAGSLRSIDINGSEATNGEYLFPLGLNLGGIEGAEFNEIDLNQMSKPVIFEGIPWNLDRRLSPGGCQANGGVCENLGASPIGDFRLDPFPFTGVGDPGLQAEFSVVIPGLGTLTGGTPKGTFNVAAFNNTANPLGLAYERIRSFVSGPFGGPRPGTVADNFNFNGNNTLVPYPTTAQDPGGQGIGGAILNSTPTPTFTLTVSLNPLGFAASARAQNDSAVTRTGVPVSVPVLFNDTTLVGTINAASVTVSLALHGTATANVDGTVTYTPSPGFSGGDSFTYTFSELTSGEVSNPATVTVSVNHRATGSFVGAAVSMDDALKAIRIAVGLATPTADDLLNGDIAPLQAPDGEITAIDALLILKKAVGLASF